MLYHDINNGSMVNINALTRYPSAMLFDVVVILIVIIFASTAILAIWIFGLRQRCCGGRWCSPFRRAVEQFLSKSRSRRGRCNHGGVGELHSGGVGR